MKEMHERDTSLRAMHEQMSNAGDVSSLNTPEMRRYLRLWEPLRREFRKHLNEPSRAPELNVSATFPELSALRMWARVEAADTRLAIWERRYARVVDNYRTVLLLSEQIRSGGGAIHHLTALGCVGTVRRDTGQAIIHLSAKECGILVQLIREWERTRVPVEQALQAERASYINLLHDLYEGKKEYVLDNYETGSHAQKRVLPVRWLNLRAAAHEAENLYERFARESRKPVIQQERLPEPGHILNAILAPDIFWGPLLRADATGTARNRLLAISAAVRAYRLSHGRHPKTLAEAGVADLNKDPFTGGEFVYKTSEKGFLVYSVGEDGRDDGGKRAANDRSPGDIGLIPYVPRPSPPPQQPLPPAPPVWLK